MLIILKTSSSLHLVVDKKLKVYRFDCIEMIPVLQNITGLNIFDGHFFENLSFFFTIYRNDSKF